MGALSELPNATPQLRSVSVRLGVRIPLRDGVALNATVYLSDYGRMCAPAVLMMTPYVSQTYHDRGMYFAAQGYPFVIVDVRGRGNSAGVFRPNINEARDGYDVVEWLARQPYCNGKVGMWGGSYSGYAQWAVAGQGPEHLATIVPVASPYIGVDFPIRGNVAMTYWMQWLTLVWGCTSQDRIFANQPWWSEQFRRWFESGTPFRELDHFLGNPSLVFQDWVAHPHLDSYWDAYNPTASQYTAISMPVLTITGIYDADQLGALTHYRQHLAHSSSVGRSRHYLVIGPWDHAGTRTPATEFCGLKVGPASLVDLAKLHCQWYAWTMQGGPKPEFLRNNVAYYVTGADCWRYSDTLEAVTAAVEPWYLQSVGNLSPSGPANSEPDHYVYDPRNVSLAQLESTIHPESRVDHRLIHARSGRQLVYHSAPFATQLEIAGFFKLSVWLGIDQPDTDFRVGVYEVALDGSTIELTSAWLRARYRESPREPKLVCTQEPQRYDFDQFTFVARRLIKGHRLRVVIGPIDSIYSEKNYNSGGIVAAESMRDARPVTVRLFHDADHPSALYVPLGASAA